MGRLGVGTLGVDLGGEGGWGEGGGMGDGWERGRGSGNGGVGGQGRRRKREAGGGERGHGGVLAVFMKSLAICTSDKYTTGGGRSVLQQRPNKV